MRHTFINILDHVPEPIRIFVSRRVSEITGLILVLISCALALALATWSAQDPSLTHATSAPAHNLLGTWGAISADLFMQMLGLASLTLLLPLASWGIRLLTTNQLEYLVFRIIFWVLGSLSASICLALVPVTKQWPLPTGLGGVLGDRLSVLFHSWSDNNQILQLIFACVFGALTLMFIAPSMGYGIHDKAFAKQEEEDFEQEEEEDEDDELDYAPPSRRPARATHDDEEEDEPGRPGLALMTLSLFFQGGLLLRSLILKSLSNLHTHISSMQRQKSFPEPLLMPPKQRPLLEQPGKFPGPIFSELQSKARPSTPKSNIPPQRSATSTVTPPIQDLYAHSPTWDALVHPQQDDLHNLTSTESEHDIQDEADIGENYMMPEEEEAPPPQRSKKGAPVKSTKPANGNMKKMGKNTTASQDTHEYELPSLSLLAEQRQAVSSKVSAETLEQNARILEGVLEDFGVRGEIIKVRPGPVVTLYELEPAPGVKSSRVIGLADDVSRSMSALSTRIAVVQGRNAIGIELPNQKREMVYLRDIFATNEFQNTKHRLAIALGKTIGGEPVVVDLARMPHLLVAGTTGSGKSVAINTMILSLLYRLSPQECRLIMIDPKMLELSMYEGIPHLLTPVVTDPKKAVVSLKWAVREMEERYKKMARLGVRNIDGFNARVSEARAKGEIIMRTVQTGFNPDTGEAVYEEETLDLAPLPYIVVIVDEMADLMLVAGKDIEGAIQRLAQMARAAGIHLIMATQRPSVDVITGTIKANFPTRISFQVTSKIDSRTVLGEQGAEQLLGQGDMLYMIGGGRISRVHGPFVSDGEVEQIVNHLKTQGHPEYLDDITAEDEEPEEESKSRGRGGKGEEYGDESGDIYDRAVAIVLRDKKCSTSYVQRRLSLGYNKAASLVERMEKEGIVSKPNHAGKREILVANSRKLIIDDGYSNESYEDEEMA